MRKSLVVVLFFSLLCTLPLHSIRKDTKLILDEVQKLAELIKILDEKVTSMSADLAAMQKKIGIIENKVNAVTESQADVNQSRENISLSLQFIKEEINELKNKISSVNDRLLTFSTASAEEITDTEGEESQNSMIQSPESIYFTAYSDYLKKNYELAIRGFRQFINLYPQNGLADNSLYWIGECYYSMGNHRHALGEFQKVFSYPDTDKDDDTQLKIAYCYIKMEDRERAIEELRKFLSDFSDSEFVPLAREKLRELGEM